MRTLSAILATLAFMASTGLAKPKKHSARLPRATTAATEAYVVQCINERTGPDGGIPVRDAIKLCQGIAKHQAKITRLAERAAKAIEACQQEVSDACVDACDNQTEGCDCTDSDLTVNHAFDVCTGHGPAWGAAKEGK